MDAACSVEAVPSGLVRDNRNVPAASVELPSEVVSDVGRLLREAPALLAGLRRLWDAVVDTEEPQAAQAAPRGRRPPPRAAAVAARPGIANSLAADNEPEGAADQENDEAAARPKPARKPCPTCRKLTTQPRKRVFFGECPVCTEGGDGLCALSCGHPVCKACWDRM